MTWLRCLGTDNNSRCFDPYKKNRPSSYQEGGSKPVLLRQDLDVAAIWCREIDIFDNGSGKYGLIDPINGSH